MSNARKLSKLVVGTEVKATGVDSDLSSTISNLKTRLDSDDAAIQALSITAAALTPSGLTDSDLKVVADLRSQLDSEIASAKSLSLDYTNYIYTATAGQTTFTGSDDNSATLSYTAGTIQVFLNGILLDGSDYTATSGTSVVLNEAAALSNELVIIVPRIHSTYAPTVTVNWGGLTQQIKLQSSTFDNNDTFARFIDFAGDYAIAGAPTDDLDSYSNNGAAFVFKRTDSDNGTGWEQQAILKDSTTQSNNYLGNAVQLNDDATFALVSGGSIVSDGFVIEYSRLTNFKLSTASYDSVSSGVIDLGDQAETEVQSLMFNNDGTKLYYLGNYAKTIYQYSLGSAYDITDMSYDSKSFSVTGQANAAPRDMKFNNDGTKLFVSDTQNGRIYQYSLSTAYDISTASYDSISLFVSSQDAQVQGFVFKPDGTKLFVVTNSNDNMYQYSLSTGYDLSTASYDSVSFNSGAFAGNDQRQMQISTDGKKLFVMGYANDAVYQINLTTAYDLSTASTSNYVSFGVGGQESLPFALVFNNDGSKMFIAGQAQDIIYQYSTDGTEWNEGQNIGDPGTTGSDKKYARFGNLEISGGTGSYFVAGAIDDDDGGNNKGSAWVYYKDSDGVPWSLQQEISDSDRGEQSEYGFALSFPNDSTIVVGAKRLSHSGNVGGGVFIWERTGTSWERTHKIINTNGSWVSAEFGRDVSMNAAGTYLAVARPRVTIDGDQNRGDVHIYYKNGSTWELQDTIQASDGGDGHYFGGSLDLRGDDVLVCTSAGAQKAYVFTRSGTTWTEQKVFTGDDSPTAFGSSFPSGAKINKDTTKNDLAIGANNRGLYIFTV